MSAAYINRIVTAVPPHDVHSVFAAFAPTLLTDDRERHILERMAQRLHIDHRFSFLKPRLSENALDEENFYRLNDPPTTDERMRYYKTHAFGLVKSAIDQLDVASLEDPITHVIVTSCTGFYAPGIDLEIVSHYDLNPSIERTIIGFMGCYAAFNGLKLAHHIVASVPTANVLLVNIELCTLHLQYTHKIDQLLSFLIFADGCAASLISRRRLGLKLDRFCSTIVPETAGQITWAIGDDGFDMFLSGQVPQSLLNSFPNMRDAILNGLTISEIDYWAIHPGGRSILDAVQKGFDLSDDAMSFSRRILQGFGNMSSATVMFVLKDILDLKAAAGRGCALAFGPGLTLESLQFVKEAL